MDWKQYEKEISDHFQREYPKAKITPDAKRIGRYSKVERQIDLLIEDTIADFHLRIVIDAKYRERPIDVTDVESFIGFCSDVDANKGLLISLKGFTKAAINRVHHDESDIELDVLNFADLKKLQAFGALPYSGNIGVVLSAPFGWIVDGKRREGAGVATLYQRGQSLDEAGAAREWMYINYWHKDGEIASLEDLIAHQERYLKEGFPMSKISYQSGPDRGTQKTSIRLFQEGSYPADEYTGFVEFETFIFFCVLYTPVELSKKNIRKLTYILKTIVPINVTHPSP